MKVLLNDGLDEEGIELFKEAGITPDIEKRDLETLIREMHMFDALVVRSATKVTKEVIESGEKGNLKIIGRAGVGYDNIDVAAANECGIVVKIAPGGNTNATAELALALMLAVSRNIPQAHYYLTSGVWRKKEFQGEELSGKTLGIIGCGRIGQRLAELTRGFMNAIGYDTNLDLVKENFPDSSIKYTSLEEVLSQADYISMHTGGKGVVIGKAELALVKPSAYIINAARGGNVDEDALYEALKEGRISGAGLDVYVDEPKQEGAAFSKRLQELSTVVLTPHLGASTDRAQRETSIEIAHSIIDYLLKGDFSGTINVSERVEMEEKPVYTVFIHHRDAPGIFTRIDETLARSDINIRQINSRGVGNTGNAETVYLVHQMVPKEVIQNLRSLPDIYSVKTGY